MIEFTIAHHHQTR